MLTVLVSSLLLIAETQLPRGVEHLTLANGLRVSLQPVAGSSTVALVTLFDIGEMHNPAGCSGLAHLVEHLYVTSAAGAVEASTATQWFKRYPKGCNAQTGIDYTVVAVVFEASKLEHELREAALRMSDLKIVADDLERELPRVENELSNMYENMPQLAVMNHAREAVDPLAKGARRGGIIAQLRATSLKQVREFHRSYYRPRNARLVLVGGFDVEKTRPLIKKLYGGIPTGEAPPPPEPSAKPRPGLHEMTVPSPGFGQWPKAVATAAYRTPDPESTHYPAFLLLVGRLLKDSMPDMRRMMREQQEGKMDVASFMFRPLDAPRVMFLSASTREAAKTDKLEATLSKRMRALVEKEPAASDRRFVRNQLGLMLGTVEPPAMLLRRNPYLVAFSLGRRQQLGIDGKRLAEQLARVTHEQLRACVKDCFAPGMAATVLMALP